MKRSPSCLALITARGGSKGVPNKNIRMLDGCPMIELTIKLSLACSYIAKTVVTTESLAIQKVALECGAEAPFLRPAELATDTAKQEDAIIHAMNWFEERGSAFDYICLLDPTVPLRKLDTLNKAFQTLHDRPDADAIVSITECDFSPIFCNTLRPSGFMEGWMEEKYKWANRQELPAYYRLCGLIFISKWETFKTQKTFLHDKAMGMIVDDIEARDINSPIDLFIIEQLMKHKLFSKKDLSDYVRNEVVGNTKVF